MNHTGEERGDILDFTPASLDSHSALFNIDGVVMCYSSRNIQTILVDL